MTRLVRKKRLLIIAATALAAFSIVFAALTVGFLYYSGSSRPSYHYSLTLSTSGPIEDAVLLLPLPSCYDPDSGTNVTPVNMSLASFTNFDGENISVKVEHIGGIPVLNISADRIDPVYTNRIVPIGIMPGQNESELPKPTHVYSNRYSEETPVLVDMELHLPGISPDHDIETRVPIGVEPLLMPCRVIGNLDGSGGFVDKNHYVSPGSTGYIVEVPFTLSFDADDENVLTISSGFLGTNQRWILGWQSNSYSESLRHEFKGPCNGTYPTRGILLTGKGVY